MSFRPAPTPTPAPPHPTGRRVPLAVPALLAGVVLLVAGTHVAGADPGDAGAAPSPCPDLARRYAPELPAGWTLECLPALPAEWSQAPGGDAAASATDRRSRRIVVLDGQSPEYTEASIAHEIAHAEATAWPPELRADVATALGARSWAEGGPASPMEVFAESSVRCRGLPTHETFPLVPCEVVEAARSAGGARGPLPVGGTRPTS